MPKGNETKDDEDKPRPVPRKLRQLGEKIVLWGHRLSIPPPLQKRRRKASNRSGAVVGSAVVGNPTLPIEGFVGQFLANDSQQLVEGPRRRRRPRHDVEQPGKAAFDEVQGAGPSSSSSALSPQALYRDLPQGVPGSSIAVPESLQSVSPTMNLYDFFPQDDENRNWERGSSSSGELRRTTPLRHEYSPAYGLPDVLPLPFQEQTESVLSQRSTFQVFSDPVAASSSGFDPAMTSASALTRSGRDSHPSQRRYQQKPYSRRSPEDSRRNLESIAGRSPDSVVQVAQRPTTSSPSDIFRGRGSTSSSDYISNYESREAPVVLQGYPGTIQEGRDCLPTTFNKEGSLLFDNYMVGPSHIRHTGLSPAIPPLNIDSDHPSPGDREWDPNLNNPSFAGQGGTSEPTSPSEHANSYQMLYNRPSGMHTASTIDHLGDNRSGLWPPWQPTFQEPSPSHPTPYADSIAAGGHASRHHDDDAYPPSTRTMDPTAFTFYRPITDEWLSAPATSPQSVVYWERISAAPYRAPQVSSNDDRLFGDGAMAMLSSLPDSALNPGPSRLPSLAGEGSFRYQENLVAPTGRYEFTVQDSHRRAAMFESFGHTPTPASPSDEHQDGGQIDIAKK
ncbi:hypothetical protein AcW1_007037 [Taiwanofungus camphoratus]|nr:hypothetical protein AcV7_005156 [Antrodia cinnamomea]KAI0955454.1 hypothetical protein AcW1_007037 [Antrodia cinnamomea]